MSVTTQEGSRSSQASAAMLAAFQADLFCHHAAYANPEEAFDPDANLHTYQAWVATIGPALAGYLFASGGGGMMHRMAG
jgi:hypothetical protein